MMLSTTLAGPNAPETIGRALRSIAPHVDMCLVVDTAAVERPDLLSDFDGSPFKIVLKHWPWRDDFAAGRNAALNLARSVGASWAIHIDDDEWLEGGEEIRPTLARSIDDKAFHMFNGTHQYLQPRAIRIPCEKRWAGRVHECIDVRGPAFERARFCEDPKTPKQVRAKALRDELVLRRLLVEEPEVARWRYYLAEALTSQGRWQEAVDHFVARAQLNGWHEEAAWACVRAGEIMSAKLDQHAEALEVLSAGLARHAGMPEILWQMALANARLGRYGQAVYCAQLAKVHGERGADDARALRHRVLWRVPKALREGPDEILAFLYETLGEQQRAEQARQRAEEWTP